jgi:cytoskeletal protein RodZ
LPTQAKTRLPEPALGAFGEKLRKQREQRGIALDAISNTTKISPRMLRALEEEHFDQLPGGVFNKGFVRAYARQVGLDEEETVTEYLAALRESQLQQQSILPDFRVPSGKSSPTGAPDLRSHEPADGDDDLPIPAADAGSDRGPDLRREDRRQKKEDRRSRPADLPSPPEPAAHLLPKRFPDKYPAGNPAEPTPQISWAALAAAVVVLILLLAFWTFRRHRDNSAASPTVAASNQSPAPPPLQPSVSSASPTMEKTTPAETQPTRTAPAPATHLAAGSPAATMSPKPVAPTQASATAPLLPPASETVASGNAASNPASTAAATKAPLRTKTTPAVKPLPTFTLLIRAEKTTWVSIVADGKPVAEETLIAPAHTSVRASHEVYVRAGNAAGVSFVLNGKEFPAQGNEGEVKSYVFDATGLHAQPANPTH